MIDIAMALLPPAVTLIAILLGLRFILFPERHIEWMLGGRRSKPRNQTEQAEEMEILGPFRQPSVIRLLGAALLAAGLFLLSIQFFIMLKTFA